MLLPDLPVIMTIMCWFSIFWVVIVCLFVCVCDWGAMAEESSSVAFSVLSSVTAVDDRHRYGFSLGERRQSLGGVWAAEPVKALSLTMCRAQRSFIRQNAHAAKCLHDWLVWILRFPDRICRICDSVPTGVAIFSTASSIQVTYGWSVGELLILLSADRWWQLEPDNSSRISSISRIPYVLNHFDFMDIWCCLLMCLNLTSLATFVQDCPSCLVNE